MLDKLTFDILARDQTDRAFRSVHQSLGRTDRAFQAVEGRAQRMGRAIAAGLGGFAVASGVRALTGQMQEAVAAMDGVAKAADKIGVTTDALQELRHAAELSGVQVETFDMALQRFTRRTAEAANGTGEAKDALREMGIELRDSAGNLRPTEELLNDVADALRAIENPAERVRIAFKLFDSEGVAMVNMLRNGSAALETMREEARDLGIVLREDLVRDAVVMQDQLTKTMAVIDARWNTFLVAFLRGIDMIGEAIARVDLIPDDTDTALAKRIDELREVQDALAARAEGGWWQDFWEGPTPELERRQSQLLEEIRKLEELRQLQQNAANVVTDGLGAGGLGGGGGTAGGGGASASIDSRADSFERLTERIREQIAEEQLLREQIGLTDEAAQALTDQYELERLELELLAEAKAAGNAVTGAEIEQARHLVAQLGEVRAARRAEAGAIQEQDAAAREAEEAERQLADAISGVSDQLISAIDRGADFIDILKLIAQQILSMPQLEGFFSGGAGFGGFLSGIVGSIFGGGGGAPSSSPVPPSKPGFAWGGEFTVGGRGGVDANLVQFMATRGEKVTVSKPGQERATQPLTLHQNITVQDARGLREAGGQVARRTAAAVRRAQQFS